ncbi:MAG: YdeI/OmpD-associated family protein [Arachnia propionica]|uniref:YdeI/OmpD-associated family protein n=1 Tax=Arachnia propionica TaxID=1750 RepID=UPI0026F8012E|nr:YdeI/OmpD-associated family protein [Arachnia propionica]
MSVSFRAVVTPHGPAGGIELTEEQAAALSAAKQPPVVVTIGQHSVRARVSRMGGSPCVFLSRASRTALGVEIGDEVEVTVALDLGERVIVPPRPIQERLDADPAVRKAWEKLSYSHQREWAMAVDDAKKDETKQRRVDQMVKKLLG